METKDYRESSLEQCLEIASNDLNIPIEELEYTIIEEKKSLFKKHVTITVKLPEVINVNDGKVKIEDGKLVVVNPKENGVPASIAPSNSVKVFVDGIELKRMQEVYENSVINFQFHESEAKRSLNISISDNKLEAYISINYLPQITYGLEDVELSKSITINAISNGEKYPPLYTFDEINQELNNLGIKYGIIEENIRQCVEKREVLKLLIAQGNDVVDDTDDFIQLNFNMDNDSKVLREDEHGSVDYRNVGAIDAVEKGEVIAIRQPGVLGKDGTDIFGNVIKKKQGKAIKLRVGPGCIIKNENTVEAVISGKPCIKNSVIYVYEVCEISQDVDLKTGNVKFLGDVKINGNVQEGMTVEAGNSVIIEKNIENATVMAKGNVEIKGNVIMSKVTAGGEDVLILQYMDILTEMKSTLEVMTEAIIEIKKFNLLGAKVTDGEIIKLLLENKYKNISKLCWKVISYNNIITNHEQSELIDCIRGKLIGMAALEIKHFSELEGIIHLISERHKAMDEMLSLPVSVNIKYSQDSTINSSGDILVTGKGVFVSDLIAHKGIYFTEERSVVRGGHISANTEIKCKTVGSTGAVATKVSVADKGNIWIDVAYVNTIIAIGLKEHNIDVPSKNVHAYINNEGDLVVDKLIL